MVSSLLMKRFLNKGEAEAPTENLQNHLGTPDRTSPLRSSLRIRHRSWMTAGIVALATIAAMTAISATPNSAHAQTVNTPSTPVSMARNATSATSNTTSATFNLLDIAGVPRDSLPADTRFYDVLITVTGVTSTRDNITPADGGSSVEFGTRSSTALTEGFRLTLDSTVASGIKFFREAAPSTKIRLRIPLDQLPDVTVPVTVTAVGLAIGSSFTLQADDIRFFGASEAGTLPTFGDATTFNIEPPGALDSITLDSESLTTFTTSATLRDNNNNTGIFNLPAGTHSGTLTVTPVNPGDIIRRVQGSGLSGLGNRSSSSGPRKFTSFAGLQDGENTMTVRITPAGEGGSTDRFYTITINVAPTVVACDQQGTTACASITPTTATLAANGGFGTFNVNIGNYSFNQGGAFLAVAIRGLTDVSRGLNSGEADCTGDTWSGCVTSITVGDFTVSVSGNAFFADGGDASGEFRLMLPRAAFTGGDAIIPITVTAGSAVPLERRGTSREFSLRGILAYGELSAGEEVSGELMHNGAVAFPRGGSGIDLPTPNRNAGTATFTIGAIVVACNPQGTTSCATITPTTANIAANGGSNSFDVNIENYNFSAGGEFLSVVISVDDDDQAFSTSPNSGRSDCTGTSTGTTWSGCVKSITGRDFTVSVSEGSGTFLTGSGRAGEFRLMVPKDVLIGSSGNATIPITVTAGSAENEVPVERYNTTGVFRMVSSLAFRKLTVGEMIGEELVGNGEAMGLVSGSAISLPDRRTDAGTASFTIVPPAAPPSGYNIIGDDANLLVGGDAVLFRVEIGGYSANIDPNEFLLANVRMSQTNGIETIGGTDTVSFTTRDFKISLADGVNLVDNDGVCVDTNGCVFLLTKGRENFQVAIPGARFVGNDNEEVVRLNVAAISSAVTREGARVETTFSAISATHHDEINAAGVPSAVIDVESIGGDRSDGSVVFTPIPGTIVLSAASETLIPIAEGTLDCSSGVCANTGSTVTPLTVQLTNLDIPATATTLLVRFSTGGAIIPAYTSGDIIGIGNMGLQHPGTDAGTGRDYAWTRRDDDDAGGWGAVLSIPVERDAEGAIVTKAITVNLLTPLSSDDDTVTLTAVDNGIHASDSFLAGGTPLGSLGPNVIPTGSVTITPNGLPAAVLTATGSTDVPAGGEAIFTIDLTNIDATNLPNQDIRLTIDLDGGSPSPAATIGTFDFIINNDPEITATDFTLDYDIDPGSSGVDSGTSNLVRSGNTVTIGINKRYFSDESTENKTITFILALRDAITVGDKISPAITRVQLDNTNDILPANIDNNGASTTDVFTTFTATRPAASATLMGAGGEIKSGGSTGTFTVQIQHYDATLLPGTDDYLAVELHTNHTLMNGDSVVTDFIGPQHGLSSLTTATDGYTIRLRSSPLIGSGRGSEINGVFLLDSGSDDDTFYVAVHKDLLAAGASANSDVISDAAGSENIAIEVATSRSTPVNSVLMLGFNGSSIQGWRDITDTGQPDPAELIPSSSIAVTNAEVAFTSIVSDASSLRSAHVNGEVVEHLGDGDVDESITIDNTRLIRLAVRATSTSAEVLVCNTTGGGGVLVPGTHSDSGEYTINDPGAAVILGVNTFIFYITAETVEDAPATCAAATTAATDTTDTTAYTLTITVSSSSSDVATLDSLTLTPTAPVAGDPTAPSDPATLTDGTGDIFLPALTSVADLAFAVTDDNAIISSISGAGITVNNSTILNNDPFDGVPATVTASIADISHNDTITFTITASDTATVINYVITINVATFAYDDASDGDLALLGEDTGTVTFQIRNYRFPSGGTIGESAQDILSIDLASYDLSGVSNDFNNANDINTPGGAQMLEGNLATLSLTDENDRSVRNINGINDNIRPYFIEHEDAGGNFFRLIVPKGALIEGGGTLTDLGDEDIVIRVSPGGTDSQTGEYGLGFVTPAPTNAGAYTGTGGGTLDASRGLAFRADPGGGRRVAFTIADPPATLTAGDNINASENNNVVGTAALTLFNVSEANGEATVSFVLTGTDATRGLRVSDDPLDPDNYISITNIDSADYLLSVADIHDGREELREIIYADVDINGDGSPDNPLGTPLGTPLHPHTFTIPAADLATGALFTVTPVADGVADPGEVVSITVTGVAFATTGGPITDIPSAVEIGITDYGPLPTLGLAVEFEDESLDADNYVTEGKSGDRGRFEIDIVNRPEETGGVALLDYILTISGDGANAGDIEVAFGSGLGGDTPVFDTVDGVTMAAGGFTMLEAHGEIIVTALADTDSNPKDVTLTITGVQFVDTGPGTDITPASSATDVATATINIIEPPSFVYANASADDIPINGREVGSVTFQIRDYRFPPASAGNDGDVFAINLSGSTLMDTNSNVVNNAFDTTNDITENDGAQSLSGNLVSLSFPSTTDTIKPYFIEKDSNSFYLIVPKALFAADAGTASAKNAEDITINVTADGANPQTGTYQLGYELDAHSNNAGAYSGTTGGTLDILRNSLISAGDPAAPASFTIVPAAVPVVTLDDTTDAVENGTNGIFTVILADFPAGADAVLTYTIATTDTATIAHAAEGTDYAAFTTNPNTVTPNTGTFTVPFSVIDATPAGGATFTIIVDALPDNTVEGDETVMLTLTAPSASAVSNSISIDDADDTADSVDVTAVVTRTSVAEGDTDFEAWVTLAKPFATDVTIPLELATVSEATISGEDADATLATGTVTIQAGKTSSLDNTNSSNSPDPSSLAITFPPNADTADEEFRVNVTAPEYLTPPIPASRRTAYQSVDNLIPGEAVTITRSADATLTALDVTDATLNVNFDPETLGYTANVASGVVRITVDPTAAIGGTYVVSSAQDSSVDNNAAAAVVDLVHGVNEITITVTAEDGTTTTGANPYVITVTRAAAGDGYTISGTSGDLIIGGDSSSFNVEIGGYTPDTNDNFLLAAVELDRVGDPGAHLFIPRNTITNSTTKMLRTESFIISLDSSVDSTIFLLTGGPTGTFQVAIPRARLDDDNTEVIRLNVVAHDDAVPGRATSFSTRAAAPYATIASGVPTGVNVANDIDERRGSVTFTPRASNNASLTGLTVGGVPVRDLDTMSPAVIIADADSYTVVATPTRGDARSLAWAIDGGDSGTFSPGTFRGPVSGLNNGDTLNITITAADGTATETYPVVVSVVAATPTLSVTATDAAADEVGLDTGLFTINLADSTAVETVLTYSIAVDALATDRNAVRDTDYEITYDGAGIHAVTTTGGTITFSADEIFNDIVGAAAATLLITPLPDNSVEYAETVILTITHASITAEATVNIADVPDQVAVALGGTLSEDDGASASIQATYTTPLAAAVTLDRPLGLWLSTANVTGGAKGGVALGTAGADYVTQANAALTQPAVGSELPTTTVGCSGSPCRVDMTIPVVDDVFVEGNEPLSVAVSEDDPVTGGTIESDPAVTAFTPRNFAITDDDSVSARVVLNPPGTPEAPLREGTTTSATVVLTGAGRFEEDVTFTLELLNATNRADDVSLSTTTVTLPRTVPGGASPTVSSASEIRILRDVDREGSEILAITIVDNPTAVTNPTPVYSTTRAKQLRIAALNLALDRSENAFIDDDDSTDATLASLTVTPATPTAGDAVDAGGSGTDPTITLPDTATGDAAGTFALAIAATDIGARITNVVAGTSNIGVTGFTPATDNTANATLANVSNGNTIIFTVTAPGGNSLLYTLTFIVPVTDRTTADLSNLTVDSLSLSTGGPATADFDPDVLSYGVTLPDGTTEATIVATPPIDAADVDISISATVMDAAGSVTAPTCDTLSGPNTCTITDIDAGETAVVTIAVTPIGGGLAKNYVVSIGPAYARLIVGNTIGGTTTIKQRDTAADAFTLRLRNYNGAPPDGFVDFRIDSNRVDLGITTFPSNFNRNDGVQEFDSPDFVVSIVDPPSGNAHSTRSHFDREENDEANNFRVLIPGDLLEAGGGNNRHANSEDVTFSVMAKPEAAIGTTEFTFGGDPHVLARAMNFGVPDTGDRPLSNASALPNDAPTGLPVSIGVTQADRGVSTLLTATLGGENISLTRNNVVPIVGKGFVRRLRGFAGGDLVLTPETAADFIRMVTGTNNEEEDLDGIDTIPNETTIGPRTIPLSGFTAGVNELTVVVRGSGDTDDTEDGTYTITIIVDGDIPELLRLATLTVDGATPVGFDAAAGIGGTARILIGAAGVIEARSLDTSTVFTLRCAYTANGTGRSPVRGTPVGTGQSTDLPAVDTATVTSYDISYLVSDGAADANLCGDRDAIDSDRNVALYTLTVNVAEPGTVASLGGLTLTPTPLGSPAVDATGAFPDFAIPLLDDTFQGNLDIRPTDEHAVVSLITAVRNVTIGNPTTPEPGTTRVALSDISNDARITFRITSETTDTIADYNLTITVRDTSITGLSDLTVGAHDLSTGGRAVAAFDAAVPNYGVTLPNGTTTATIVATPAIGGDDADISISVAAMDAEGSFTESCGTTESGPNTCTISDIDVGETAVATITVTSVSGVEAAYTVSIGPAYARIVGGGSIARGATDPDAFTIQIRNYKRVPDDGFANIRIDTDNDNFGLLSPAPSLAEWRLANSSFNPADTFLRDVETADFNMSIAGNIGPASASRITRSAFNREGSSNSEGISGRKNFRISVPQVLLKGGMGSNPGVNSEDVVVSLMARTDVMNRATVFEFGASTGNPYVSASDSNYNTVSGNANHIYRDNALGSATIAVTNVAATATLTAPVENAASELNNVTGIATLALSNNVTEIAGDATVSFILADSTATREDDYTLAVTDSGGARTITYDATDTNGDGFGTPDDPHTFTIPAANLAGGATFTVTPVADGVVDDAENVVITVTRVDFAADTTTDIDSFAANADTATIAIADYGTLPTVVVVASSDDDNNIIEGTDGLGTFTITLTNAPAKTATLDYTLVVGGAHPANSDITAAFGTGVTGVGVAAPVVGGGGGQITMSGATGAITVRASADSDGEEDETVTFTITGVTFDDTGDGTDITNFALPGNTAADTIDIFERATFVYAGASTANITINSNDRGEVTFEIRNYRFPAASESPNDVLAINLASYAIDGVNNDFGVQNDQLVANRGAQMLMGNLATISLTDDDDDSRGGTVNGIEDDIRPYLIRQRISSTAFSGNFFHLIVPKGALIAGGGVSSQRGRGDEDIVIKVAAGGMSPQTGTYGLGFQLAVTNASAYSGTPGGNLGASLGQAFRADPYNGSNDDPEVSFNFVETTALSGFTITSDDSTAITPDGHNVPIGAKDSAPSVTTPAFPGARLPIGGAAGSFNVEIHGYTDGITASVLVANVGISDVDPNGVLKSIRPPVRNPPPDRSDADRIAWKPIPNNTTTEFRAAGYRISLDQSAADDGVIFVTNSGDGFGVAMPGALFTTDNMQTVKINVEATTANKDTSDDPDELDAIGGKRLVFTAQNAVRPDSITPEGNNNRTTSLNGISAANSRGSVTFTPSSPSPPMR